MLSLIVRDSVCDWSNDHIIATYSCDCHMVTIAKKVFMGKVMIFNSAIIPEVYSRPSQMAKDVVSYLRKKLCLICLTGFWMFLSILEFFMSK